MAFLIWSAMAMWLPQLPNLGSNCRVALFWTSNIRTEPTNKLLMQRSATGILRHRRANGFKEVELPMKQIYSFDNNSVWAHRCRHGVGGSFLAGLLPIRRPSFTTSGIGLCSSAMREQLDLQPLTCFLASHC